MGDMFGVGDVVQLKSGGPRMTVERAFSTSGGALVECCWYDNSLQSSQESIDSGGFHRWNFLVTSLEPA